MLSLTGTELSTTQYYLGSKTLLYIHWKCVISYQMTGHSLKILNVFLSVSIKHLFIEDD